MTSPFSPSPPAPPPSGPREVPHDVVRPGMARAWLVVGSIAAVVLLAVGPVAVASLVSHEEHAVSRTYAADVVRAVVLHVDEGRVQVVGDETDVVRVSGRVSRGLRRTPVTIAVTDGRLTIDSDCTGPFGLHCGVDLTVHVPPGVTVAGATVDADVEIHRTTGTVDLTGRDANVTLDGLTGPVRADVRDGNVQGGSLGAGPVRVSTRDGDVDLAFDVAPTAVAATVRDGAVTVVVPSGTGPYAVSASSGDGAVDTPVRTDPASPRTVALAARDGDVALRYPAT